MSSICPAAQIDRCLADHRQPTPARFEQVLASLGYRTDYLVDEGHVWTHGLGEQERYAIQHTLRFQIWELDQPHFLHAHGRSLTGHKIPEQEHHQMAALRQQFATSTRFDEDD